MTSAEAEPNPRLSIQLFGPICVRAAGRELGPRDFGGIKPKQLLEILILARGRTVTKDRLAELLWAEKLPQRVSGALENYVSVLRRNIDPDGGGRDLVITEPGGYRFAVEQVELDTERFDDLNERAAQAPTAAARRLWKESLALAERGELLEDEIFAGWVEDHRATYRARLLGVLLDAAEAALAENDYGEGLAHAEHAIALDRFGERAHRTAVLALYALGRQHEALQAYDRLRGLLNDELGIDPTPATTALQTAVLRQEDVSSLLPREARQIEPGPKPSHLPLLGRTEELAVLERTLSAALDGSFAFILVEGETGSGKSRLLNEVVSRLPGVGVGSVVCSELERHLPYVALAGALRALIVDLPFDAAKLPALRAVLPELALRDEPREFAEVEVLESLVELIGARAPLVLILDDLQWADDASIAALGYLQRRCAGTPAAILGAASLGDHDSDHPLRHLAPTAVVTLEPLTETELAHLGMPDLYERTGGRPDLVAVAMSNGTRGDLVSALSNVVLARCRAEGPENFSLLLGASVMEGSFSAELLAAVLRLDPVELIERLERLSERKLLAIDGHCFRFRFGLVRDVLRASMSPARLRLLRERAAAAPPAPASTDESFERVEHPIFILDPANDRIHDVNRAACEFLGYGRDELLATPISAVHPAEISQLAAWSAGVRETGRGWSMKFSCRTKTGEIIPTEMEAYAPDERGYVFGFVRDVSEHRSGAPSEVLQRTSCQA